MLVVSAVPNVMVSLPPVPMVSVFDTVAVLLVAESQYVVAGAEIDAGIVRRDPQRDGVGGRCRRSVLATSPTVPVLATLARVSVLSPVPRSTDMAVVSAVGQGDVVVAGTAGDGSRRWRR